MKKLEGEVLEAIIDLGGQPDRYSDFPAEAGKDLVGQRLARTGGRFTVDPHQFYGLEVNRRAVPIAELVLWIGYLKWQLKTAGVESLATPVLDAYGTIRQQDAVIAYDRQEPLCDEGGKPLSRWDGVTKKLHAITGEEVPDPDAQVSLYTYVDSKPAPLPDVEFIVGNPPFIGNKRMIQRLGEGYVEAVRRAYPAVASSVDLVMYWWWRASQVVKGGTSRGFGFVTTSKISQPFNRTVLVDYINGTPTCSIVFAVPDHPWNDEETSAAVRVAFTVGRSGDAVGVQQRVVRESPDGSVNLVGSAGKISAMLATTGGASVPKKLFANAVLSHQGVIPLGEGFRLDVEEAYDLGYPEGPEGRAIKPYKIGRDLLQRDQGLFIIDLYGFEWKQVADTFPRLAQIVLDRVKSERDQNRRLRRREKFWLYADTCEDMRQALDGEARYIATCRTAKHRVFIFYVQMYCLMQKLLRSRLEKVKRCRF